MTLLELGIFQQQIPVLFRSYHPIKGVKKEMTAYKRSHLIQIIKRMGEHIFNGEFKHLGLEDKTIYFETDDDESQNSPTNQSMIIAISDRLSDPEIVRKLLKKLLLAFNLQYPIGSDPVKDSEQFEPFIQEIDHVLSDETKTPLQRVITSLFKQSL